MPENVLSFGYFPTLPAIRCRSAKFGGPAADFGDRLAHFKDEQTAVESAIETDELFRKFPDFPEHDLVRELRTPKIKKHASAILEGKSMIDQIVAEYIRVVEDDDSDTLRRVS